LAVLAQGSDLPGRDQQGAEQIMDVAALITRIRGRPDYAVILNGSGAQNHGTFWTGPIDFAVEIVSRGDRSRRKLPFYSKIGVREVLFVERHPWRLKLYRHDGTTLELAGSGEIDDAAALESGVLPFSFRLVAAVQRPEIQLTHKTDGRTWRA
jgi:hypothetical protein